MKRNLFEALAMIILAAVVSVPSVQAQQRARANVPFAFQAGDKVLPAGTYLVSSVAERGVMIRNIDSNQSVMVIAQSAERVDPQGAKLVFHCYGERRYLSEIWYGSAIGIEIAPGNHEKEERLAKKNVDASYVVIALR